MVHFQAAIKSMLSIIVDILLNFLPFLVGDKFSVFPAIGTTANNSWSFHSTAKQN